MPLLVPVHSDVPALSQLVADLRDYGLAVVDFIRPAAEQIADQLRHELALPTGQEDQGEFLLHLSCLVEPADQIGWVDYYVYPRAFERGVLQAKRLIEGAVRQWHIAGQPSRFVARLNA